MGIPYSFILSVIWKITFFFEKSCVKVLLFRILVVPLHSLFRKRVIPAWDLR